LTHARQQQHDDHAGNRNKRHVSENMFHLLKSSERGAVAIQHSSLMTVKAQSEGARL
jgi:hypothetical protein